MEIAHNTGTLKDERDATNPRNVHSRKVKTRIKEFLRKFFQKDKNKFESLREVKEAENKMHTTIISKGK